MRLRGNAWMDAWQVYKCSTERQKRSHHGASSCSSKVLLLFSSSPSLSSLPDVSQPPWGNTAQTQCYILIVKINNDTTHKHGNSRNAYLLSGSFSFRRLLFVRVRLPSGFVILLVFVQVFVALPVTVSSFLLTVRLWWCLVDTQSQWGHPVHLNYCWLCTVNRAAQLMNFFFFND